jgi:hypothetical protein
MRRRGSIPAQGEGGGHRILSQIIIKPSCRTAKTTAALIPAMIANPTRHHKLLARRILSSSCLLHND